MFCRLCGVKIPDDSKFCFSCGSKVVLSPENHSKSKHDKKEQVTVDSIERKTKAKSKLLTGSLQFEGTYLGYLLESCLIPLFYAVTIIFTSWGTEVNVKWHVNCLKIFLKNDYRSEDIKIAFLGNAKDIWFPCMVLAITMVVPGGVFLLFPLQAYLVLLIQRWIFNGIIIRGKKVCFDTDYGPFLGRWTLFLLSVITLVFIPWALSSFLKWICSRISCGSGTIRFKGNAWVVLGFLIQAVLLCLPIITIPVAYNGFVKNMCGMMVISKPESSALTKISRKKLKLGAKTDLERWRKPS